MRRSLVFGAVIGLLAALLTAAGLEWDTRAHEAALDRSASELRARLYAEPNRRVRAEIAEFEKGQAQLQTQVQLIEEVRNAQRCPDKALASAIPGPAAHGPLMTVRSFALNGTALVIEARPGSAESATRLARDLASNYQARVDRLSVRADGFSLTATLAGRGCPVPAGSPPPKVP